MIRTAKSLTFPKRKKSIRPSQQKQPRPRLTVGDVLYAMEHVNLAKPCATCERVREAAKDIFTSSLRQAYLTQDLAFAINALRAALNGEATP